MKIVRFSRIVIFILLITICSLVAEDVHVQPVTPNPSPEAIELLNFIYCISGKQTLTGQHCNPLAGDSRLFIVYRSTKHYPALFGQDFGFSPPGTWDGINFRQQIVEHAIRRYHDGFINTIMWHAVPPTEDEPVEFRESVQSDLTDQEWQDLITPGTEIHERWKSQVDVIAFFLKQIRDAGVPILWRPYHEMNGGWFWWGKKTGEDGYKKLWRMLYDRLVHFHRLNNLIWVYNANEVKENVDPYENTFPGHDVVDIVATDVYSEGFNQLNYDQLLELAGNKPIALGEVGRAPSREILRKQPRWTWFMSWGEPRGWQDREAFQEFLQLYDCDETLTYEELPGAKFKEPTLHHPILK
ncbi:glycoside hydrolase family 26 protein [bacterium]